MHLLSAQRKSTHLVEDFVGRLGPVEGRALLVMRGDICKDGLTQLRHAGVRSAAQGFLGKQAKESLDEVEPGRVGWREMQVKAEMAKQPPMHDRRAMRRQVVQHHMNVERMVDARVDLTQKRDE